MTAACIDAKISSTMASLSELDPELNRKIEERGKAKLSSGRVLVLRGEVYDYGGLFVNKIDEGDYLEVGLEARSTENHPSGESGVLVGRVVEKTKGILLVVHNTLKRRALLDRSVNIGTQLGPRARNRGGILKSFVMPRGWVALDPDGTCFGDAKRNWELPSRYAYAKVNGHVVFDARSNENARK